MSGNDSQQRLAETERELARLLVENERLRTLLTLAQRTQAIITGGDRQDCWAGTRVGSDASAAEKVALIRSLFRGRDDVYALRWESARSGKSGYAPATAGGWVKNGPKSYLPLSDGAVERHLRGRESIGVYPLLEDDRCWFLACDFDGAAWQLDALALLEVC